MSIPKAFEMTGFVFRSLDKLVSRPLTNSRFGLCFRAVSIFLCKFAIGFREYDMWLMFLASTPDSFKQYAIACEGKPAQCLILRSRSSSIAAINSPFISRHADESP